MVDEIVKTEENNRGLVLKGEHAKWIFMGKQPIIVLDQDLSSVTDTQLMLLDKEWCYGVIRLLPPNKISHDLFDQRQNFHLTTEDEKPELNNAMLHEYPFQWIVKYDYPVRWDSKGTLETLVEKIDLFKEATLSEIPGDTLKIIERIYETKVWMPYIMQEYFPISSLPSAYNELKLFIPNKYYGQVMSYNTAKSKWEKDELSGNIESICITNGKVSIKPEQSSVSSLFQLNEDKVSQFKILSKGIFTVNNMNQNKITFVLKATEDNELEGHFNLIKNDENIWIFNKVGKPGPISKVDSFLIEKIYKLRENHSIREISIVTGLSPITIYRALSNMNSIYPD